MTAAVQEYEKKHFARCEASTKETHAKLDAALGKLEIKCTVTSRTKSPQSLEAKIRKERKGRLRIEALLPELGTEGDCDRIKDLAGVRVSLYFPSDWVFVERTIFKEFKNVTVNLHPNPNRIQPTRKRFDGYAARHYYVDAAKGLRAEIQVASALMHSWMEVDHNLAYKQDSGPLYAEELAMLDGLNGLTAAGEILIDGLKLRLLARNAIRLPRTTWVARSAVEQSRTEFCVIGQNLFSLMVGEPDGVDGAEAFKDALIDRLRKEKSLKATLVVADPKDSDQMKKLGYGFPKFEKHLRKSVKAMKDLRRRAEQKGLSGRLTVGKSGQVGPESLIVSDSEDSDGVVYLIHTSLGSRLKDRAIIKIGKRRHAAQFTEITRHYSWRSCAESGFQPL